MTIASIFLSLFAISLLGSSAEPCRAADANQRDMLLWYRQPATDWLQALPLGNGMIGAMMFGGVPQERIALNESSFWSGRPHNYDNPEAFQYFAQIRDLVFAEKFQEAERMVNDRFYGRPKAQEAYQPIGDLLLSCATNSVPWKPASPKSAIARATRRLPARRSSPGPTACW
jgi:alpha-L-fucosidase 2